MQSLQSWQGFFWPLQDAAVPGRCQAGLGSPTFLAGSLLLGTGIVPGTQGIHTDWPWCCHLFKAPKCTKRSYTESLALHQGTLQHTCEGVFTQLHTPGLGSEPAELHQMENRIFPSQAGSPRTLGASTWLLKHSYTGSSSPRDATAYCCNHGALSQILWKTWIFSMF